MVQGRVQEKDTVFLNGRLYRIRGQVQRQIANEFAPKTVIGEFSEESDPVLSQITWRDFGGGQGRYIADVTNPEHFTEFWTGNIRNDIPGHILPSAGFTGLTFNMLDSAGNDTALTIVDYAVGAHTGRSTNQLYWVNTDSASNHNLQNRNVHTHTLLSQPQAFSVGVLGNKQAWVVAESTTTEWAFSSTDLTDTSNWFTDTSQTFKSIAFWRDMVWGLSTSGELFFSGEDQSTATLNWTSVAKAQFVDPTSIRKLAVLEITLPTQEGLSHLAISRDNGFDIYDRLTERFVPALRLPSTNQAGRNLISWNGSVYYPYGLSLFQWTPTANGNVVTDVGLSQKEGMPFKFSGHIYDIAASQRQLFASVTTSSATDTARLDAVYARTITTGWSRYADVGDTADNDRNTQVVSPMYVGEDFPNNVATDYILIPGWKIAAAPQQYRSFHVSLGRESVANDTARIDFPTAANAELVSPWVIADGNQDWTALRLSTEVEHMYDDGNVGSSHSVFKLEYATNFSDSGYTTALQLGSSAGTDSTKQEGRFDISLPNASNPVGLPFTAFRFRATWQGIFNNAYDVHNITLTFQKKPRLRHAFSFDIDISESSPDGRSPKEQREALDDFFMQQTLGEFTYHDDEPGGGRSYFVTPISPVANEETGNPEAGAMRMTVMEVN